MPPAKKAAAVEVRAIRAHTQPGTLTYRAEGDTFIHRGELYKHVEPVTAAKPGNDAQADAGNDGGNEGDE